MICIEPEDMKDYFEEKMASTTLGPFNRDEVRQMVSDYLEQHRDRHDYELHGVCREGGNETDEGCRGS